MRKWEIVHDITQGGMPKAEVKRQLKNDWRFDPEKELILSRFIVWQQKYAILNQMLNDEELGALRLNNDVLRTFEQIYEEEERKKRERLRQQEINANEELV